MKLPTDHPRLGGKHTGKIPHAKKPKYRPPRGLRDHGWFPGRALPTYTGPYSVGTMEIEVPAQSPRSFSRIKREHRHILRLETVLMTIYYPASHKDHNLQKHDSRVSRELWLGRPRASIAKGYGKFAGVGSLAIPVFLPTMLTKLPAYRNAPIAMYWAPEVDTKEGGPQVKVKQGARPEGAPHDPVFPLIMFSHGLGGTRTMYSSVCGEFASYGFVVCAVEHRDGSGPRTYINHPKEGPGSIADLDKIDGIDHKKDEREQGFCIIDYIFPEDNPKDTAPNNEKGVDRELRAAQVDLRMAELEEAYSVICELNGGNGQLVADRNLRCEGYKASSKHGLEGITWSRWKGRVFTEHVTICGHSFGAATAVEMLRHGERFSHITQGIIYDIWGAGTRPAADDDHKIRSPIIAINSEAFTYWPSNFELISSLIDEAQDGPNAVPAWLMTLRGTVHVSQSDFSLLYPNVCSLFLKMVANPRRALDLNINASLEFLSHTLPAEMAMVNRAYKNENLLECDISPLDRIPSFQLHRPNEKYTALRLKIRHEWIYRISPQLFRKYKRWELKRKGQGEELGGEVWLHSKPSAKSIREYLSRVPGRSSNRVEEFDRSKPAEETNKTEPVKADHPSGGGHTFVNPEQGP